MLGQGRQGPWQPQGSGLLVGVVVLSVVALVGHGALALSLLRGTVRHPTGTPSGTTATTAPTHTAGPVETDGWNDAMVGWFDRSSGLLAAYHRPSCERSRQLTR